MRANDVILRSAANIIVFIIVTFSAFLFFAGHNNPGGGFIGGLMAASALVLVALAYDIETIRKVLPFNFHIVTAIGLLIALLTSAGAVLFDVPFLSHYYEYRDLPLLGNTALHTAVLFDLGVYCSVVGVTMTIILSIGEDT
jgi:multicomponent Na+:H+ antiporter subunit B